MFLSFSKYVFTKVQNLKNKKRTFGLNFRGVLQVRAEIIPFEPDVGNATVGKKTAHRAPIGILLFIVPLFNVSL